jgi:hypothetical protein
MKSNPILWETKDPEGEPEALSNVAAVVSARGFG